MADNYYEEYKDLYLAAQTKGKYKMFLLDVKNSKIHSSRDKMEFYNGISKFVDKTTSDLLNLEMEKGHKILHRHLETSDLKKEQNLKDKVVLAKSQRTEIKENSLFRLDQLNPLHWMGDLIHFIVEKDSISDEDFTKILQNNKDAIIPNYDFHFINGYYETDVWSDSSDKFSRVYCIPVLEQLSKKQATLLETHPSKKTISGKEL